MKDEEVVLTASDVPLGKFSVLKLISNVSVVST